MARRYIGMVFLAALAGACSGGNGVTIHDPGIASVPVSGTSNIAGIEIEVFQPYMGDVAESLLKTDLSGDYLITETTGKWEYVAGSAPLVSVLDVGNSRSSGFHSYQYAQRTIPGSYQYVQAYFLTPDSEPHLDDYHTGILGVPADAGTLPSGIQAPVAVYNGEAVGKLYWYLEDSQPFFEAGCCVSKSRVTVNFPANTVNVDIHVGKHNLDKIQVHGMKINGNSFSGGNIVTTGAVNHTGGYRYAQGYFYGTSNSDGVPKEVGGLIASRASLDILASNVKPVGGFYFIFLGK